MLETILENIRDTLPNSMIQKKLIEGHTVIVTVMCPETDGFITKMVDFNENFIDDKTGVLPVGRDIFQLIFPGVEIQDYYVHMKANTVPDKERINSLMEMIKGPLGPGLTISDVFSELDRLTDNYLLDLDLDFTLGLKKPIRCQINLVMGSNIDPQSLLTELMIEKGRSGFFEDYDIFGGFAFTPILEEDGSFVKESPAKWILHLILMNEAAAGD